MFARVPAGRASRRALTPLASRARPRAVARLRGLSDNFGKMLQLTPLISRYSRCLLLSFVALAACLSLAACGGGGARADENARRYDLKGKVISVDKARREVVVEHEEIPGFMEAMTMPFALRDEDALAAVAPGDTIQATLAVTDEAYWLEAPAISRSLGGEAAAGAEQYGAEPASGAEVPNFRLVNQDGRQVGLGDYRGRALLFTFIYTRCPLPEYCALMSTNFARLEEELAKDSDLYDRTHLLSVSIDPDYDKPPVLKTYAAQQAGRRRAEDFRHWEFATGPPEEVKKFAGFFGLTYSGEGTQIVHSLRTVLVTPDGRVHKIYRGNEWQPDAVLRDVKKLLQGGSAG